jgi:RNA polymerase sigma-70 factor, ECF subfamily
MNDVDALTDAALVDAMRRGDEAAFAALYAAHHPAIYRYARQMCGPSAADDVVQEVFAALLRRNGFDASQGTLAAYLFGIARHHILKRLSLSRHELQLDDEEIEPVECCRPSTPFDDMSRAEIVESVRAAVRALPPLYREVIALCELQDMDYTTAATVIGCPIGTVRSRLHRARALLGAKMARLAGGRVKIAGRRSVPARVE